MKKIILLFVVALFTFSCTTEPVSLNTEAKTDSSLSTAKISATAKPASSASTSNFDDYTIAVTVSPDGSEWTYLVTKAKSSAKTLSHFIISLNNCAENSATFSDVISASVNGDPVDLSATEGSGTGCNPQDLTTNFIKFPSFSAASSWTLVIKFNRGYNTFENGTAWVKAGTSCNQGTVIAPGCPKEVYCSFSQGFYFSGGAMNNGAVAYWNNGGLTIGGINYTQEQGQLAWTTNNGPGKDTTINAFFQLSAVRLSGVESQVAADAAIIDAYFNGINIFNTINSSGDFVLPSEAGGYTKDQVKAAGTRIGEYIKANHC